MIKRYRFNFENYENGIDDFVNQNYGNFTDNSLFENDSFTLGNIYEFGYELEFQKGEFNIANTYYSKPYPDAYFYDNIGTVKMNYRLTYNFNPVYYYQNYFTLSDIRSEIDSKQDYKYIGHGSYIFTKNDRYLLNGIKINFENNLDYLSNDYYISTTAGSYNLNPNITEGESPFLSVNRDINNYKLGTNPIVLENNYKLIYANSELSNNKIGLFNNSYNNNSYANKNSCYFRDFTNESVSFELGALNCLYKLDNYDYYTPINIYNNVVIPTTNNFYGSNNVGLLYNSSYDLFSNIYSNGLICPFPNKSYIFPFTFTEAKEKSLFFSHFRFYSETGKTGIDYLNKQDITFTSRTDGITTLIQSSVIKNNYEIPIENNPIIKEPTFSNTIYFNNLDDIDLVINGLYLGTVDNPLIYNESYSENITNGFNNAMNITIATYSIGGIITAIFLFRMLFAMIRSNK